jgi:acetyl esterase/lipase
LNGQLDDLQAATEWVLGQASVDEERVVLAGNIMGGYNALAGGAKDSRFEAVVAICPLIDPTNVPLSQDLANEYAQMLQGITAKELMNEWDNLAPIEEISDGLRGRKVLLITADLDELFPTSHYEHFVKGLPALERQRMSNADHSLCTCRRELVEAVVQWLSRID